MSTQTPSHMLFEAFIDLSAGVPEGSLRAAAAAGDLARVEALLAAWRAQCPVDDQGALEFEAGDCDFYASPETAGASGRPEPPNPARVGYWDAVGPRWASSLMLAAQNGHVECLKALLPFSNPEFCCEEGFTALHLAAAHGHALCVEILAPVSDAHAGLECVVDANREEGFLRAGLTALHLAARQGHADCVNILIPISDVDQADADGRTAVFFAALQDRLDCLKALFPISKRVISKKGNHQGRTVLMAAAAALGQQTSCLEHLLQLCDPKEVDSDRWSALCFASQAGNVRAMEFLRPLSDLSVRLTGDWEGETALHAAARSSNPNAARLLLSHFDANIQDSNGVTPIAIAANFGNFETAQALLPFSNPTILTKTGESIFSSACRSPVFYSELLAAGVDPEAFSSGRCDLIEFLGILEPFSDVNLRSCGSAGWTPLAFLAESREADALSWLAQRCDPNLALSDGTTPLMIAARQGRHSEATRALLPFSNVNAQNDKGQTALMHAVFKPDSNGAPNDAAMAIVAWPGVNFELRDNLGQTALLWAALMDNTALAQAILSRASAALPRTADKKGSTPLSVACKAGNLELVQSLLAAGAGADALLADAAGETLLMDAARKSFALEAVNLLLPFSDAMARNSAGHTALDVSLMGNELAISALLPASDLCAQNPLTGQTPLMVALSESTSSGLQAVAAATPDIAFDTVDNEGGTALMCAVARKGNVTRHLADILLLATKTDLEITDRMGRSVFDVLVKAQAWDFLDPILAHAAPDLFERAFFRCAAALAPASSARFESMSLAREAGIGAGQESAPRKQNANQDDAAPIPDTVSSAENESVIARTDALTPSVAPAARFSRRI